MPISVLKYWGAFLAKGLLRLLLVLIGVSSITFASTRMIGNPAYLIAGDRATPEMIDSIMQDMGLDRPLWEQYRNYMLSVAQGDLGTSRFTFQPVVVDLMDRLPATVEISTVALILGMLWCIPIGIVSAVRKGGFVDKFVAVVANQIGLSVPSFWLGLLLIYGLSFQMQLLPMPLGRLDFDLVSPTHVTGLFVVDSILARDLVTLKSALMHLLLPSITLAIGFSPPILQLTRDTVLQIIESEPIRGAIAFGLPSRIIYPRYVLKQAIPPVATSIALTFGWMLSGTVLVETVFAWPGIGLYAVEAINHLDYEPVIGLVLVSAAIYVIIFFLTDLLHFTLDPRLRSE